MWVPVHENGLRFMCLKVTAAKSELLFLNFRLDGWLKTAALRTIEAAKSYKVGVAMPYLLYI